MGRVLAATQHRMVLAAVQRGMIVLAATAESKECYLIISSPYYKKMIETFEKELSDPS